MLLSIIGVFAAFVAGYSFFWGAAIRLKKAAGLSPPVVGYKYRGFQSYADLQSHVFGATALWAPFVGVGSVALIASLGWRDSIWVFSALLGYVLAIWRFWRKPRKAWEAEDLPVWDA